MRPATDARPKSLLPVAGRPFADWQLAWLSGEPVERVTFSIGHLGEAIRHHLGDGRRFGVEIDYVDENGCPLGTAGALRLAADTGALEETFCVLYGDSYLPIRLGPLLEEYGRRRLPVLMTVFRDPGHLEQPNVVFDDGMVQRYEKGLADPPPEMRHVDYGFSIWRREVIERIVPPGEPMDLATPLQALSRSERLAGAEVAERFYEIGSPAGLRDLEAYLRSGLAPDGTSRSGIRPGGAE